MYQQELYKALARLEREDRDNWSATYDTYGDRYNTHNREQERIERIIRECGLGKKGRR